MAEAAWSWGRANIYDPRESASNLVMLVVNRLLKPAQFAWAWFVVSFFEPLQLFRLPDTAAAVVVTFLIADFAYYWFHRLNHEVSALWALHHTHHSSPWMNLTTAVRLNWVAKFVGPLFFMPLVILGLSPKILAASMAIILLYQFPLHTQAIGRLGWFEGKLLNTPSAHRVHHGSNTQYIDKNYGGMLIVWDRLFDTYEPEGAPVQYGVTTGFIGHNPLAAQFLPLVKYLRGQWRTQKGMS